MLFSIELQIRVGEMGCTQLEVTGSECVGGGRQKEHVIEVMRRR